MRICWLICAFVVRIKHKHYYEPTINRFNHQTLDPIIWAASSEFGTYRLCEQRRFRRACASAQSRQNLRYSLIQAVSQEEPSDRKPDPWPLWMAGHARRHKFAWRGSFAMFSILYNVSETDSHIHYPLLHRNKPTFNFRTIISRDVLTTVTWFKCTVFFTTLRD